MRLRFRPFPIAIRVAVAIKIAVATFVPIDFVNEQDSSTSQLGNCVDAIRPRPREIRRLGEPRSWRKAVAVPTFGLPTMGSQSQFQERRVYVCPHSVRFVRRARGATGVVERFSRLRFEFLCSFDPINLLQSPSRRRSIATE